MASERKTIVVPSSDLPAGNIPFAIVTGEGVDDYDKTAKQYTASIIHTKKSAKAMKEAVLEFWEENKAKGAGDKPNNFDNMVRTKDDGTLISYFKTTTSFGDGKPNVIAMVDAKRNPLDPAVYGMFGGSSTGRIAIDMKVYQEGKPSSGVSLFLKSVQLVTFEKLSSGGTDEFGDEEGEALGETGFESEAPKKKKKKK